MQKTFKVYNENVTRVTVNIPDGATDQDIAELINEQYYNGINLYREEIEEPIGIEDEDGNDLTERFLCTGNKYSYEELRNLLRSVVDYEIFDHESGDGLEAAHRNLEAMGFSEEQMRYFGFPETE